MPLTASALVTLEEAYEYLQLVDPVEERTKRLVENLITRSSDRLADETERTLVEADGIEFFDGQGGDTLVLTKYPVASVAELNVDFTRVFGAVTEIPATDYVIDDARGTIRLLGRNTATILAFRRGVQNIKLDSKGGFPLDEIPSKLKEACLLLVARRFNRIRQRAEGITSESVAGYSVSYEGVTRDSGLPLEVQALIKTFIRVPVL